ncbi:o-succinylbenzoate synthase [Brevibacterium sp. UCMA 11754]|uniref:o-succinylbenzoate synthase n=1 Tax=Brevibacterium sp. UCMA 11754 TaxID=2749198 RepID=UPI001F447055|nr:o-succinylbenzoate synthase [Brevibacterium sp. UCMA 11754]MCF2571055.1 o-succinylbenzoate synthase [Brevibacterium sp. UCMA 11754]
MADTEQIPESIAEIVPNFQVLKLPMVTRFRKITEREIMLFEGPVGWAEFSPFTEYDAAESSRWLRAALEFAGLLPGAAAAGPSAVGHSADTSGQSAAAVRSVAVNATLPACATSEVESILARYGPVGTVKAKVAEHGIDSLSGDLERLREFRRLFPSTTLRLDANAGYTLPEALRACAEFVEFDLQYFEQPVAAVEDMARLREQLDGLPVVLAADESIRKAEDPLRVAELGAAEVVIVKVQPLGGIAAARSIIEACGLPAVVSSALESSVGLAAGAHLAATLPRTPVSREILGEHPACGLGTGRLFAEDVVSADLSLSPVDGQIPVTRIVPDPQRLERLAVDPGRFDWWSTRLQECWSALRPSLPSSRS